MKNSAPWSRSNIWPSIGFATMGGILGCGYGFALTGLGLAMGGAGHGTMLFYDMGCGFPFGVYNWAIIGALLALPRGWPVVVPVVSLKLVYYGGIMSNALSGKYRWDDLADLIMLLPFSFPVMLLAGTGQWFVWWRIYSLTRRREAMGPHP